MELTPIQDGSLHISSIDEPEPTIEAGIEREKWKIDC